jgi:hypothetical protein
MFHLKHSLRVLLFVAASCLVVNDLARLVFSFNEQYMAIQMGNITEEENNNKTNAFSIFEEEVKHKDNAPVQSLDTPAEEPLEVFIAHLIKDDEVRHLAYLPIFSPPPNVIG